MIIGLSGHKGVGKTTLARYASLTYGLRLYSFAEPLKRLCRELFWPDVESRDDALMPLRRRRILQSVGFELRKHDPHVFIRLLVNRIIADDLGSDPEFWDIIIDDVRYVSEADWIRSKRGLVLRLEDRTVTAARDEHASETELDQYEFDAVYFRESKSCPQGAQKWLDGILFDAGLTIPNPMMTELE